MLNSIFGFFFLSCKEKKKEKNLLQSSKKKKKKKKKKGKKHTHTQNSCISHCLFSKKNPKKQKTTKKKKLWDKPFFFLPYPQNLEKFGFCCCHCFGGYMKWIHNQINQLCVRCELGKSTWKLAMLFDLWLCCHICSTLLGIHNSTTRHPTGFVPYIGNKVRYMIDKFAPFHNQMSVFHNIFIKFL